MHRALAASALGLGLAVAACNASDGTPSPAGSVTGAATSGPGATSPASAGASGSTAAPSGAEVTAGAGPSEPGSGGTASSAPSASPEPAATPAASTAPSPRPTPSASGAPASAGPSAVTSPAPREYQAPEDLEVGQCYSPILDEDDDFLLAAIIRPCEEPHRAEVVGIERLPGNAGSPYPGDDAIDRQAEAACDRAFEAYVGVPYDESRLRAVFYAPTERTWPGGDRRVTCVVEAGRQALTATVRGTRR